MLDWTAIDTVLLDMDGTLLDLHFDTRFWREQVPRRYAKMRGLDVETAHRVLAPVFARTAGTLNWYCLDFWSRELGFDVAAMKHESAEFIAILPGALEFLAAIRSRGKRAVLVTNAHPRSLELKLERTRLGAHLDNIVCAHDIGFPKEHEAFWHHLQAQERYDPPRTLLVDDNLDVLRCASRYGIAHLVAACRPDSRQPPRRAAGFIELHRFLDIMPVS